jgi:serine/threonine-protein kinase RsbW
VQGAAPGGVDSPIVKRGDGHRHGADTDVLRLTTPASADSLGSIRAGVADFLRGHGADDAVIADFELAVSELATNVIRHTPASSISLLLSHEPDRWVLDVAEADGVPPLESVELPDVTQVTGRGLFVVKSVMDRVAVVDVGDAQVVRCIRFISA